MSVRGSIAEIGDLSSYRFGQLSIALVGRQSRTLLKTSRHDRWTDAHVNRVTTRTSAAARQHVETAGHVNGNDGTVQFESQ
jgi:hypothetical protein